MKRLLKTILQSAWVQKILVSMCAYYIKLVYVTSRKKFVGFEHIHNAVEAGTPLIICFWHGRMALLPPTWRWKHKPFAMLLSAHRDGKMIGDLLTKFGIETIVGSSTRGGSNAARCIYEDLHKGKVIGITPDGPRGPREEVSPGIIRLAQHSGACIIPVGFSTTKGRHLRSWDRFLLPYPFGLCAFVAGEPLHIQGQAPEGVDYRHLIKTALDAATKASDALTHAVAPTQ
jgi:lysophospholipid acyltransferase (LPLAT)-like uncharacterized protein